MIAIEQPPVQLSPASLSEENGSLAHRVQLFLARRHVPALRHLCVEVASGIVTLSGRVGTFYEKQLSQSCARHVPGVRGVIDNVRVVPTHRTNPRANRTWSYYVTSGQTGAMAAAIDRTRTDTTSQIQE